MTATIGERRRTSGYSTAARGGLPAGASPEFTEWRDSGLQRAMWQGRPTWVVSRYEDIRSALVDPRLSAETIKTRLRAAGVDGRNAGDLRRASTTQNIIACAA